MNLQFLILICLKKNVRKKPLVIMYFETIISVLYFVYICL